MHQLRHLPFEDLGFAKIDHHRPLRAACRNGFGAAYLASIINY
jgi:hypothetical protein